MAIWFTSDHHFGHANIIKYCDRPFTTIEEMNARMQDAWNSVVERNDTVYYLGDFAMDPQLVSEILPNLNGTKILIAGNHDRCFTGNSNWIDHYLASGFESVQKKLEMEIAELPVILNHFPYRNESDPDQRHVESRPIDQGGWLVHGHVHNQKSSTNKSMLV